MEKELTIIHIESDVETIESDKWQTQTKADSDEPKQPSALLVCSVTNMQIAVLVICLSAGVLMIANGFNTAFHDELSSAQPRRIIKTKDYFQNENSPLFTQPSFYLMLEMEVTPNLWEKLIANSSEYDDRLTDPAYSNLSNPDVNLTWILEDYVLNLNHRLWGDSDSVPEGVDPSLAASQDSTFKGYCFSYEHFEDSLMSTFENEVNFTWGTFQMSVSDNYWLVCLLLTIDIGETAFANGDMQKCHFYMDWKIILPYFYEYLGWALDGYFFVARDWKREGLAYDQVKQASVDFTHVKVAPAICGPLVWDSAVSHDMAQWGGIGGMITMTMTEKFLNGDNEITAQTTAQQNGLITGCQIFTETRHEVHYWESFAPYTWWMAVSNAGAVWSLVTVVFLFFARYISDLSRQGHESVTKCDLGILVKMDRNEKMRLQIENKLVHVQDKTEVLSNTVPSMRDVKSMVKKEISKDDNFPEAQEYQF